MTPKLKTIAHVWLDYYPGLFAEPHDALLKEGEFHSVLIAQTLWRLDGTLAPNVFPLVRRDVKKLLDRSLMRRVLKRLWLPVKEYQFQRFCERLWREHDVGLVHAHFGTTGAQILPLLRKNSLPLVVSFYGVDASASLRQPRMLKKYKEMFARADVVFVLCETVRQRLISNGCAEQKIQLWNIPAGVENYHYQEREPYTGNRPTRILMTARFVEKKGHIFALDALDRLLKSGCSVELTFMGYGPLKEWIVAEAKRLDILEHIKVIDTEIGLDFVKSYNEALSSHDLFILPSTTAANGDDEGGPALTLVAAQAAGMPVVCTAFPGAEVSVVDGVTGFFCKENGASLAERCSFLIEHPELWNKVGRAARDLCEKEFSFTGQMARMSAVYREVFARKS